MICGYNKRHPVSMAPDGLKNCDFGWQSERGPPWLHGLGKTTTDIAVEIWQGEVSMVDKRHYDS